MADLPQTRQSLLIRLQDSASDTAWSEFVEVYEQAIYAYARRRGLQDADAWDVTQGVLAAVEKKISEWQHGADRGSFRGWLFRVARNIAVDKISSQSRRAVGSGDSRVARALAEHADRSQQQSSMFWYDYRRKLLHWAANRVKSDYQESSWQAFWLTAVEGQKAEVVASKLGMSIGSVYAAKFRIVKRIRQVVSTLDDKEYFDGEIETRELGI